MRCIFVSDLHGSMRRYEALFRYIESNAPDVVFIGGDILPHSMATLSALPAVKSDFINDFMAERLGRLKGKMGDEYPQIFVILGNDDERFEEAAILDAAGRGIWQYANNRKFELGDYTVYGYAYVPPTPFMLKDWERYDVSRYVDPGCTPPDAGRRSVPVSKDEMEFSTIKDDLNALAGKDGLKRAVFLFHSPPYRTKLDRAALDGRVIDHVPLDVHIGSIAIQRFIKKRQPYLTLHGHVHEAERLTGAWRDRIGRTEMFGAGHDGPELKIIEFELGALEGARRVFLE